MRISDWSSDVCSSDLLKAYLHQLEEAEKRDHRKIAKALDLFHQQEEAPGMVFWHPRGWALWQVVEQYMRKAYRDHGYQEVRCPQILDEIGRATCRERVCQYV